MKKRLISLILALSLILTLVPSAMAIAFLDGAEDYLPDDELHPLIRTLSIDVDFDEISLDLLEGLPEWARPGVASAIEKGFVPVDIQNGFDTDITREEFVTMAVMWLEYVLGADIDSLLELAGAERDPDVFTDIGSAYIQAAAALGMVDTSVDTFRPNGTFDRQQAAALITNICKAFGADVDSAPPATFADMGDVAAWAVNAVNFVQYRDIMIGSDNRFDPALPFTRMLAIIMVNNLTAELLIPQAAQSTPLMWRVTCPDGNIVYLFGSIHAANATAYPLPAVIVEAFLRADYLAVEFDIIAWLSDEDSQSIHNAAIRYPEGESLSDEIGEELFNALAALFEEFEDEFDADELNRLRPQTVVSRLTALALNEAGILVEYGIDLMFLLIAYELGMDILELEDSESQMELLYGFSLPLQKYLLEAAMAIELSAGEIATLLDIWKAGNEEAAAEFILKDDDMPEDLWEEYHDGILIQRDLAMTAVIEQYLADGMYVFVVVGLAHLLGDDSIIDLLRQRGYTVEKISGS
jgi:uncharacterized protein YbaP (TraB family)